MSDRPVSPPGLPVTIAVLGASSLTVMANATISPGLPGLNDHFADVPNIRFLAGLIVTLPSLFVILFASGFGWLADRYDRLHILMAGMAIYALGGVSGLFVETLPAMLVGRAILGIGVAGTMTLAITLAGDLWHGEARQKFMGLQAAAMSGGGVVFIMLGGLLASMSWRLPFLIYLLALPFAVYAGLALRAADTRPTRAKTPEALTGGDVAQTPPFPWARVGPVYLLGFVFMVVFYLVPTQLPFLLASMDITSPSAAALGMASATLVSVPGSMLYGRLRRHVSGAGIFGMGFVIMGVGVSILSVAGNFATIILGTLTLGGGMGTIFPNFNAFIMGRVPDALRGRASGMTTTSIFGGQFLSPFASAPIIAAWGLRNTFLFFAVIMLAIGIGIALGAMRGSARQVREA
ncbi:MFS transporter [Mesobaculum littorinae]|nr:MFS transporter [Mesobaculum littorinae]